MPGGFRCSAFLGPRKEIASLQHERATFSTFEPAADCIFPVSSVKRQFPDVVSARTRTPCGLSRSDSLQRLAKIGAMPGFLCKAFFEKGENDDFLAHESLR